MENQNDKQPSTALDKMNELYSWLTTWEKYVTKENRERETVIEDQPRKRVYVKRKK